MLEAERILATGDARGPVQGPDPGEIIAVLVQTGAIAADSPLPGQLAALCQRLGAVWWLTDGAGNWHVAMPGEPWTSPDGTQAFGLRLTPRSPRSRTPPRS